MTRERTPRGGWLPPGPDTWIGETREQYERRYYFARPVAVQFGARPNSAAAGPAVATKPASSSGASPGCHERQDAGNPWARATDRRKGRQGQLSLQQQELAL